jgi:hypothetical protein
VDIEEVETPDTGSDIERNDVRDAIGEAFDTEMEKTPAQDGGPSEDKKPTVEVHEGETPAQASARARDEAGRFAKQPKEAKGGHGASPDAPAGGVTPPAGAQAPAGGPPVPGAAPEPQGAFERAPQAWKPGAREAWAALPQDVRQEVLRRERETTVALQESAGARQLAERIQSIVSPYEAMIRSEGSEPLRAIERLLQGAGVLRMGSPQAKAAMVAQVVKEYGVDIVHLDSALAGQSPPEGYQPQQQVNIQAIVEQAKQAALAEFQQARVRVHQQNAVGDVEKFMASHEFAPDLREDMALVMEAASRKGLELSLDDAYARAVQMNPEVAAIVKQREAAAKAGNGTASTQRARLATASVRSAPTGARPKPDSESSSVRDDIMQAIEDAEGA